MNDLISKRQIVDKIQDLFLDKYEEKANSDLTGFFKEVLKILVNDKGQSWISVKDKMPQTGESVLVYGKNGISLVGAYWKWGWTTTGYCNVITHWMPLPELPKGENDG